MVQELGTIKTNHDIRINVLMWHLAPNNGWPFKYALYGFLKHLIKITLTLYSVLL